MPKMDPPSPQAAGQRLERRPAQATGPKSSSDDSMPQAKRMKHDDNEDQHSSNDTAPSSVASALPEEILIAIFSDINPRTNQFRDSANDSFWSSSDILNVALTCRRFYRLVAPRAFESWCHRTWGAKDGKYRQDWSPCLRAILWKPVLGTYLRTVEVDLGKDYYWKNGGPANERGDFRNWLESDFELADAVVNRLCVRDIWKEFPGGISKMVLRDPQRPWNGKRGQTKIEEITAEEASQEWSRCIRAGRCDAILALLMVLAPNMEELRVSGFEGFECYGSHSWESFRIGEDSNFLERIFRGATNSQLAELANVGDDKGRRMGELLSTLRSIEIRTQKDDTRRTEVKQVLPYLTLPSLDYASLKGLEDIWGTDRDVHGVKLFLKTLDVAFHNSEGVTSTRRVLRCCPNIEHLSYSSTGEFKDGEDDGKEEDLLEQLSVIVPQLKSLTIGDTDFVRMEGSTAVPNFDREDDDDDPFLEQLTSLDIHWNHISWCGYDGSLWRLFPPTLQNLTLRDVWFDALPDFLREFQGLAEARREGLVPNLKKVVIYHAKDRETTKRDGVEDRNLEELEEPCAVDALEEACKNAPVTVQQVYKELVTSLDINWDDISDEIDGWANSLWGSLPSSLESLTVRNSLSKKCFVGDLLQQVEGLPAWKERLVPHLKEVVFVHGSTKSDVKRQVGGAVFEAMEKACKNAPISVTQVYM